MKRRTIFLALLLLAPLGVWAQTTHYQPTWESLNQRATPSWFDEAKFGIFIHWGVYSVPAYADPHSNGGQAYAEWYWQHLEDKQSPTWAFHLRNYGANFQYQDFAPDFKAQLYDPDQWVELFERAGARYVVLTSKHHEGFCLWPCPASWNWNSVDVGPHRDLAGDLVKAGVARGLKMGFYYSLYEWYNPDYHNQSERYVTEHMIPQMKDLVERYKPSLLWTDGEWDHPSSFWHSTEFLAWLYNESSVKDTIAVNDRWGEETRSTDGGYFTSEYASFVKKGVTLGPQHKWEECQGIGKSFGYNRVETADDYKTPKTLVDLLIDTVASGGNLLLDIGPTADGLVPVIMQQRLLALGAWLKVNGEAIYGTHPWRETTDGDVRYTTKGGVVYALAKSWPGHELVLTAPKTTPRTMITLLGADTPLKWRSEGGRLHIELPVLTSQEMQTSEAFVLKLAPVD